MRKLTRLLGHRPGVLVLGAAMLAALLTLSAPRAARAELPDFSVTTADGKVTPADFQGKLLVMFFSFPG